MTWSQVTTTQKSVFWTSNSEVMLTFSFACLFVYTYSSTCTISPPIHSFVGFFKKLKCIFIVFKNYFGFSDSGQRMLVSKTAIQSEWIPFRIWLNFTYSKSSGPSVVLFVENEVIFVDFCHCHVITLFCMYDFGRIWYELTKLRHIFRKHFFVNE